MVTSFNKIILLPKSSIHRLLSNIFSMVFLKYEFSKKKWSCILATYCTFDFYFKSFLWYLFISSNDFNIPILILGVSYISTSIIFSVRETLKNFDNGFSLIFLPICFMTLHVAYGLGSFFGLFYFINKWNDKDLKDKYFNKDKF